MSINTKFDNLIIVKNGLILKNGSKRERKISFSKLDKIYIKLSKLDPLYELALNLFLFLLILLSVYYVSIEKVIFVGLFSFILVFVKIKNYKIYRLIICLKDGTVFRKKVFLKTKDETISVVITIRKEQLNHRTKINMSYQLEH